jgi:hypothetical protein
MVHETSPLPLNAFSPVKVAPLPRWQKSLLASQIVRFAAQHRFVKEIGGQSQLALERTLTIICQPIRCHQLRLV